MSRNYEEARFAVGSGEGLRSSVWKVWRSKADVYLAARQLGGRVKISFHRSGKIRDAFTTHFQKQRELEDPGARRERLVWERGDYSGSGAVRLYQVCFPHSELRDLPLDSDLTKGDVNWIPVSESGNATFVELMLTQPGKEQLELRNFSPATAAPVAHWFLPTGENLLVIARQGQLNDAELVQIRTTVAGIPPDPRLASFPQPSSRLHLAMDPIDGVGGTIETAWPCTV